MGCVVIINLPSCCNSKRYLVEGNDVAKAACEALDGDEALQQPRMVALSMLVVLSMVHVTFSLLDIHSKSGDPRHETAQERREVAEALDEFLRQHA
jgi:hypothetical protein